MIFCKRNARAAPKRSDGGPDSVSAVAAVMAEYVRAVRLLWRTSQRDRLEPVLDLRYLRIDNVQASHL
jgi:hypothetical protein